jgi:hypothetical protein
MRSDTIAAVSIETLSQGQKLAAISMLVVAVAAFLPWVSLFGLSKSGIEGDGAITLVCALVGLVVLWLRARLPRRLVVGVLLTGAAITTLVGVVDMNSAAAMGLYLTLFGGIAWLAGVIWDIRSGAPVTEVPKQGSSEASGDG